MHEAACLVLHVERLVQGGEGTLPVARPHEGLALPTGQGAVECKLVATSSLCCHTAFDAALHLRQEQLAFFAVEDAALRDGL